MKIFSNRLETIMLVKNAIVYNYIIVSRRFLNKRKLLAPFFHKNSANFVEKSFFRFLFFCCLTPCIKKCNNNFQKSVSLSYTLGYELPILTIQFP